MSILYVYVDAACPHPWCPWSESHSADSENSTVENMTRDSDTEQPDTDTDDLICHQCRTARKSGVSDRFVTAYGDNTFGSNINSPYRPLSVPCVTTTVLNALSMGLES
jgi:hypothetical protein